MQEINFIVGWMEMMSRFIWCSTTKRPGAAGGCFSAKANLISKWSNEWESLWYYIVMARVLREAKQWFGGGSLHTVALFGIVVGVARETYRQFLGKQAEESNILNGRRIFGRIAFFYYYFLSSDKRRLILFLCKCLVACLLWLEGGWGVRFCSDSPAT